MIIKVVAGEDLKAGRLVCFHEDGKVYNVKPGEIMMTHTRARDPDGSFPEVAAGAEVAMAIPLTKVELPPLKICPECCGQGVWHRYDCKTARAMQS